MKREIFRHGKYEMCEVLQTTTTSDTLTPKDYLLCFSEHTGPFIAQQAMGTWCEMDNYTLFYDLKQFVNNTTQGEQP